MLAALIALAVGLPASVIGNGAWELCKSVAGSLYRLVPSPSPLTLTEFYRDISKRTTGTFGHGTSLVETVSGPTGVVKEQLLFEVFSNSMSHDERIAFADLALTRRGVTLLPFTIIHVQNTGAQNLVPGDFGGPIRLDLSQDTTFVVNVPDKTLGFARAIHPPTPQDGSFLEIEPFFLRSGDSFILALGSSHGPVGITNAWGGPVAAVREFPVLRALNSKR